MSSYWILFPGLFHFFVEFANDLTQAESIMDLIEWNFNFQGVCLRELGITQSKQRMKPVRGFIWMYTLMAFNYFTYNYKGKRRPLVHIALLKELNKIQDQFMHTYKICSVH